MDLLEQFAAEHWQTAFSAADEGRALTALEAGRVLYFPRLRFKFEGSEAALLGGQWRRRSRKNVSYDPARGMLAGVDSDTDLRALLMASMWRFGDAARDLLYALLPSYRTAMTRARTSFRPVEVGGRRAPSYRKDDARLHVDAFPSRPTGGSRILRVFCNVNPLAEPRQWRLGEPFGDYARRFVPRIRPALPGSAMLLEFLGVTKGRRTAYDHYMLQLHDRGKADLDYQRGSPQVPFAFPSGSTWVVFTDQVLHAAHAGCYLLEQTFHLPVAALAHPEHSPLRVLERLVGRSLA